MKKTKIVQIIGSLVITTAMAITVVSCGTAELEIEDATLNAQIVQSEETTNKNGNNVQIESNTENIDESQPQQSGGTTEDVTEEETEKEFIYNPVDFAEVENNQAKYEELMKERTTYNDHMKSVLKLSLFFSKEDIANAIYNVVRIDNDLSSLLVKIYAEEKEEVKDKVYLADQIETLEKVLNEMTELKTLMQESEKVWSEYIDDIDKVDAEKIEKVQKFSLMPLNGPIGQLEKEIKGLKADLEEALNAQSQD